MLRLFAAALLLFVWPLAAGNLISSLWKDKKTSFAGMIAEGAVCMLAVFEVLFLIISNTGRGLSVLAVAWLALTALVFAGSAAALFLRRKAKKADQEKKKSYIVSVVLPIMISAALIMAAVFISKVPAVNEQYRAAETTVVILRDGTFFGTDPLTGWWLADVTPDQRVEALPALYAVICYLTGITKPWQLLCTVAAVWVILLALSVLYEAADRLFSAAKSSENNGYFKKHFRVLCMVFCLCALCAGDAYRNPFYDLIHVTYEGRTILSFLILPMIFLSMVSLGGVSSLGFKGTDDRKTQDADRLEEEKKDVSDKERGKEERPGQKGSVILHAILCITAAVLAAGCTCGIGCGLFPALCELLVLVVCLIGWNLQKRFTA